VLHYTYTASLVVFFTSHYNAKCKVDLSFILYYITPVFIILVSWSFKALLGIFVPIVTILQTLSVKSMKTCVTGWLSPKLWQTIELIEAAGFRCTWLVVTAISGITLCVWGDKMIILNKKGFSALTWHVWNYFFVWSGTFCCLIPIFTKLFLKRTILHNCTCKSKYKEIQ